MIFKGHPYLEFSPVILIKGIILHICMYKRFFLSQGSVKKNRFKKWFAKWGVVYVMCYSMLKIIKEAFPIFVVQKVTLLGKHITKSYIQKVT